MVGEEGLSPEDVVRHGRSCGRRIPHVLVSCGGDGAFLFGAETALRGVCELDPPSVASTVGGGDSMLAGFLAAALADEDPVSCFRQALAVAAASVSSLIPGDFDRARVEELLPRTVLNPVAE
jgi:1-phosphofructokinase